MKVMARRYLKRERERERERECVCVWERERGGRETKREEKKLRSFISQVIDIFWHLSI